jgi:hypothetical protein
MYLDKSDQNPYKFPKDNMENALFNNKTISSEEKIDLAKNILVLVDAFRKIYPLEDINNELDKEMIKFIRIDKEIKALIKSNKNIVKEIDKDGEVKFVDNAKDLQRWFILTNESCVARRMMTNGIENQLESDEFLPRLVIKDK